MIVYVDEVLFINFISDFFILMSLRTFLRQKAGMWRLIISSFILSLYSVIYYITNIRLNIFTTIAVLLFVLYFTFRPKSKKNYLKIIFGFFSSAFVFGGCVLFVKNFVMNLNFILFFISLFAGYFIFSGICRIRRKNIVRNASSVNITIIKNNRTITVPSVVDTGNSLYDVVSRRPVIVVDYEFVKPLLPDKIRNAFELGCDPVEMFAMAPLNLRLIPYKSLGVKHGRIIGFCADKLLSDGKEIDAIIGISPSPVSVNNEYNGLVSPIVYV